MPKPRELSRWRQPSRWAPLLILGVLLLGGIVFRVVSRTAAKAEVDAIRERGLPVTPLELDSWYKRVPASENAALLFLQAHREYVAPAKGMEPNETKETFKPGEALPPKLAAAVAAYVSNNTVTLQKINEAAALRASRYPVDLTRGFAALLPHLASVRQMSELLKWAAIQRSVEGKPDQAVQIVQNGFLLAASLEQEPIVISQIIRVGCLSTLLKGLEAVVNERPLSDEQLVALSNALQNAEDAGKPAMKRAIAGERAIAIPAFGLSYREFAGLASVAPSGYELDDAVKVSVYGLRRVIGLQHSDQRFYLKSLDSVEKTIELDFPQMLPASEEVMRTVEKEMSEHRWRYMISQLLLPALPNAAKKQVFLVARLRCAQMGLAIERYRQKNGGQLPSLDQLMPEYLKEVPRDPADDSALEYTLNQGKGYTVLAGGSTDLFNEGRRPTNQQDIAFTVAR